MLAFAAQPIVIEVVVAEARIAAAETIVASVEPTKAATFTGAARGSGKAGKDDFSERQLGIAFRPEK